MPQNMAPYKIQKRGKKFVVVNNAGDVKGTFPTRDAALGQMRALYASVPGAGKVADRKPWTGKQKRPARVKADTTDSILAAPDDGDDSPQFLAVALDSLLDAFGVWLATIPADKLTPELIQAIALLGAADCVSDELLEALGLQDPDDDSAEAPEMAAAKPYGDVTYADPGYQKDKKKRYPIDTADHVRAAWSYISQASNAAKYTPQQREQIKSRIQSAAKKLGVDITAEKAAQWERLQRQYGPRPQTASETIVEPEPNAPVEPAPVETPAEAQPDAADAPILAPSELVTTLKPGLSGYGQGLTGWGTIYSLQAPGTYTINTNATAAPATAVQRVPEGAEPSVPAEKAFVTEINGKTLITGRASAFELEKAMAGNPHFLWMAGKFVGAEKANRNGAFWTTGDLELGQVSVKHGPLNWLHEDRHVIGTIADAQLVTRNEKANLNLNQPHIQATSAIWKWLYPDEAWVVEQASDQGKLWYSMECISNEVACVGSGSCGASVPYVDYITSTGASCEHMRQRSAERRFAEPTFLGGAVIVPPARPGWAEADASVLRQAASLAEGTFEQAGNPDVPASEWEQLMAQILRFGGTK